MVDVTEQTPARRDWRDTFSTATDLALAGILITVAAAPVVTAGAAFATGSAAVHHWVEHRSWPSLRELAGTFGRAILPGLGATLVALGLGLLLVLDLAALANGTVPGGAPLITVTGLLTAAVVGLAAVVLVEVGAREGRHWSASAKAAVLRAARTVALVPAMVGTLVVPALLAFFIPVTAPIALGFTVFALHVVARRYP